MDKAISVWQDDGGSQSGEDRLIGTLNQIAWAVQIRSHLEAEFDRLRKVLEYATTRQSPKDVIDIEAIIQILDDKRTEVMGNEQAGYFIHQWQEMGNQVSRLIVEDPGTRQLERAKKPVSNHGTIKRTDSPPNARRKYDQFPHITSIGLMPRLFFISGHGAGPQQIS